jgi:hypothetical protein
MTSTDPMPVINSILYPELLPSQAHRVRIWPHNGSTYAECECHAFAMQSLGVDAASRSHVTWHSQMHGEVVR